MTDPSPSSFVGSYAARRFALYALSISRTCSGFRRRHAAFVSRVRTILQASQKTARPSTFTSRQRRHNPSRRRFGWAFSFRVRAVATGSGLRIVENNVRRMFITRFLDTIRGVAKLCRLSFSIPLITMGCLLDLYPHP